MPIRRAFSTKFFSEFNLDAASEKCFWFGILPPNFPDPKIHILAVLLMQYGIWGAKLKKKLPSYLKIEGDVIFALATIAKLKKQLFIANDDFSRKIRESVLHGGLH
jgi:hypothetical protein